MSVAVPRERWEIEAEVCRDLPYASAARVQAPISERRRAEYDNWIRWLRRPTPAQFLRRVLAA